MSCRGQGFLWPPLAVSVQMWQDLPAAVYKAGSWIMALDVSTVRIAADGSHFWPRLLPRVSCSSMSWCCLKNSHEMSNMESTICSYHSNWDCKKKHVIPVLINVNSSVMYMFLFSEGDKRSLPWSLLAAKIHSPESSLFSNLKISIDFKYFFRIYTSRWSIIIIVDKW